jgi:hypothetical protein
MNWDLKKKLTYTNKKENQIFLIYREIQNGAVAKSYTRLGKVSFDSVRAL